MFCSIHMISFLLWKVIDDVSYDIHMVLFLS